MEFKVEFKEESCEQVSQYTDSLEGDYVTFYKISQYFLCLYCIRELSGLQMWQRGKNAFGKKKV